MDNPVAPVLAQHESWISLDPVQGCPAHCVYCYLVPQRLTHQSPRQYEQPDTIYQQLLAYRFFRNHETPAGDPLPICIGNYTDMCLTPQNRDFLLALLHQHQQIMPEVPVCIVTKSVLDDDFLYQVNQTGLQIIFFISLSFLPRQFEKGTPLTEDRLSNFARIARYNHLQAVHFWRPLTSLNIPDRDTARRQIEALQQAEAKVSVVTGLKYGDRLAHTFLTEHDHPLHDYFGQHNRQNAFYNEIFEPEVQTAVFELARELNYPVYLHTSCALSFLLKQVDYNATFRRPYLTQKCLASHCPAAQRERCFHFREEMPVPPQRLLNQIAGLLDLPAELITYSPEQDIIFIQRALTQEEQTFLTHLTSFPVRGHDLIPTLEWVGSINRKEDNHHAGF